AVRGVCGLLFNAPADLRNARFWHFAPVRCIAASRRVSKGNRTVCRRSSARPPLTSGPEDFHLRALPEPYVNLSIHTAPVVRPLPWHSCQWANRVGFVRRSHANQSRAPLVL